MKNFWTWLVTSSADPLQTSVTVRGFLVFIVGIIVQIAPLACALVAALCVDPSQLNPFVDGIVNFVKTALELVGAGIMLIGLVRKAWLGRWSHPAAVQ